MSGFEDAAIAFDRALGNTPAEPSGGIEERSAPERMFDNVGALEVDDDSPLQGGGDGIPVKGEKPAKQPKAKEPLDEEERPNDGEFYPDDEDGADGKDDDEGPDADEDDEKDEDADEELYEVTVDGKPQQVSLKEALSGYIRQETFHQRLNDIEAVATGLRAEAAEVSKTRAAYVKQINDFKKYSDALIPQEPDWDAEYAKDPANARALQKRYEQLKEVKTNLDAEAARVQEEQRTADLKSYNQWVEGENAKIAANNPRWSDEKVAKADLTDMMGTALAAQFTREEVLSIRDSRMITVLLKAAKYDRIMSKQPVRVRKGGKAVNSGVVPSTPSRSAPRSGRQALDRLAKTGSVEAAGDFFTNLITNRR
jgi:hypothetical protein